MEAELKKDGVSKNGTLLSIHGLDLLVRMQHLSYRSLDLEVAFCMGSAIKRKQCWEYLQHTCDSQNAHDNFEERNPAPVGMHEKGESSSCIVHFAAGMVHATQVLVWTSRFHYIYGSEDSLKTAIAAMYTYSLDG